MMILVGGAWFQNHSEGSPQRISALQAAQASWRNSPWSSWPIVFSLLGALCGDQRPHRGAQTQSRQVRGPGKGSSGASCQARASEVRNIYKQNCTERNGSIPTLCSRDNLTPTRWTWRGFVRGPFNVCGDRRKPRHMSGQH